MHPAIYAEFERIVGALQIRGRILEVGAVAKPESLLAMPCLREEERIGINIKGDLEYAGFKIIACNANKMEMFPDGHFDFVLSNATIEHDPFFWKTCSEIRRVLRVGGAAVIGAPGFTKAAELAALGITSKLDEDAQRDSALTFRYHGAPRDYYRFSDTAIREVVFRGYRDVMVTSVLVPPRLIGYGFKT